jgi:AcrR family transcriptional regulator
MPKQIDHEKRRKQIAEATWRVILDKGLIGASVRNIAEEAGVSLGALRHYFTTQDELLVYAMRLVKEQATVRIKKIAMSDLPLKEKVLQILLEMVPTNKETMAEMEVWFAFTFHARHKQELFGEMKSEIYKAVKNLITSMDAVGLLKKNLDLEVEYESLYALVDGLAIHAMLEKDRLQEDQIKKVLMRHLDSICET